MRAAHIQFAIYQNSHKISSANIIFHVCRVPFFMCQMQINEIISVIFHQQTIIFIEMPAICCFGLNNNNFVLHNRVVHFTHETQMKFILSFMLLVDGWRKRHHNYTHVPLYLICQLFHFQGCVYICSYYKCVELDFTVGLRIFWIAWACCERLAGNLQQLNNTISNKSVLWA